LFSFQNPQKELDVSQPLIDPSQIIQFSSDVHTVAQQQERRFKQYVPVMQMTGDRFAYDGLGRVEAREVSGTVVPVSFDSITHTRRLIRRKRFVVTLPIDASNVAGALFDPQSNYAAEIAKAMNRAYDRVVVDAAFADVQTGRDFENTVTATNDGVKTVTATGGMIYERILEIQQNFFDSDVGVDVNERVFMTITGKEQNQLMQEIEVINSDYTQNYVVDRGQLTSFSRIEFIPFAANVPSPIIPVSGGQRALIAACTGGIVLGVSRDIQIKIQERSDYYSTTQVVAEMEIGAVRTEGAKVQRVNVTV